MKTIFSRLFGSDQSKKVHALNAWIIDLAEMDDISALRFSTQQLAKITAAENTNPQQLLDLILEVEEVNAARLERLNMQFVHIDIIKPELELNITETCYDYSRQSYIFHLKVIEKVINPSNFRLQNDQALLIIARALYCATNMLKWRMFVQTNAPTKMWLQIYTLYRIANQQALLNFPITLFNAANVDLIAKAGFKNQTTLSAYFIQICMLGQLAQANMHKLHLDISSKILNTLLTRAEISHRYSVKTHLFFIDCEKDAPAKRMRNIEPCEHCRYWELDELEKQITVAINTSDRGEIPQSLLTSKITNAQQLHETLNILYAEWTKLNYARQRRKESRHATSKTAKVNAGIANICLQVHQSNQLSSGLRVSRDGKSFDERIFSHTTLSNANTLSNGSLMNSGLIINSASLDVWIVTDESSHGIGTRVNKYANILARPNKLVALVMDENPSQVIIGIIRGVKSTHANQLKVGIEVYSHYPTWVQLSQTNSNESFPNTIAETEAFNRTSGVDIGAFSGIYIPIEAGLAKSSYLILPKINYRLNTTYAISIAGVPKRVKLGEIIESRDDWVKVLFPF